MKFILQYVGQFLFRGKSGKSHASLLMLCCALSFCFFLSLNYNLFLTTNLKWLKLITMFIVIIFVWLYPALFSNKFWKFSLWENLKPEEQLSLKKAISTEDKVSYLC